MMSATPIKALADRVLQIMSSHHSCVVLGPTRLQPLPGNDIYFVLGVVDQEDAWSFTEINSPEPDLIEQVRAALLIELLTQRPRGLIIHDADDELYMVRLCHAICPTPATNRIRRAIEAERAGGCA